MSGIATAKSPRSEPGSASAGFVAPIVVRAVRDRALALEHERERRPGGDEVDELAEERLRLVLGVVLFRERAVDRQQARGAQPEAAALEARDDLARERASHRVGLREDQRLLDGHGARVYCDDEERRRRRGRASTTGRSIPVDSTGVSQYGHTCHSASSGALQFAHACLSRVVHTGHTRNDGSMLARQTGHWLPRRLSRSSIALISSSRSRTSSRYSGRAEEHVDERAEERREEPEQRREPDEPAIADPPARVLVDPEGDPEPEDDDEEDPDVADRVPRPRVEEVVDSAESRVGGEDGHRISFPIM